MPSDRVRGSGPARPVGRFSRKAGEQTPAEAARKIGTNCFLEESRVDGAHNLVLVGELDLSCSERFAATLEAAIAAELPHVLIDLRSVTFVDSTGLALLLKANTLARQEDFRLDIVRSSVELVQAVFEAAGVGKLLPLCDAPPSQPS
jgi:anti-sigma B factor antagonist